MNQLDIVGVIGEFSSCIDIFRLAAVNTTWAAAFRRHKRIAIQKVMEQIHIAHCLHNLCPCSMEKMGLFFVQFFRSEIHNLENLACKELNHEKTPTWFKNLIVFPN